MRAPIRRRSWLGWALTFTTSAVVAGFAFACGVVLQSTRPAPEHPIPANWNAGDLTIAYVGHATVLIDLGGVRILTDPVFFDRIGVRLGPLTLGPKRLVGTALTFEELPPLDAIVVSHAHLDSLDLPSLRRLMATPLLVLPPRTKDLVADLGFPRVVELGWGESLEEGGIDIEAVEVDHWGKRWPWEHWRGYNGYVFGRGAARILFASDTAYTEKVGAIGRERGVTVAIIGNGAYDPWIGNHADPEQVWRMFEESGAQYLVPIHWGTFRLGKEPLGDAMRRLFAAAGPRGDCVVIRDIGATWSLPLP
ncbi:MAG: MBL fold metallo-hydrolase [Dehalococcoidia bacterium]|nr:MBL fold metallo-hydrolase [Dehalococcoidia bacterium]